MLLKPCLCSFYSSFNYIHGQNSWQFEHYGRIRQNSYGRADTRTKMAQISFWHNSAQFRHLNFENRIKNTTSTQTNALEKLHQFLHKQLLRKVRPVSSAM